MGTHRKLHGIERDNRERTDRCIVKYDPENIAGGPNAPLEVYERATRILLFDSIRIRPGDLVVVAASRFVAKRVLPVLASLPMQWRWQDGPDGADKALLDFSDLRHESRRRSRYVIASGDGIFADEAKLAAELGMSTHQIIGHGKPSKALWNSCNTHTKLRLERPLVQPVHALAA